MITWRKIMIDASTYTITVRKDVFDGEECFEARIAEFPDICEYGDNFDEAYKLAIDSIETTALLLREQGKSIPDPIIHADNYSGRVTLRLPKSLHRALVNAADNEGISLNQHLTNVLNYYTGYAQANAVR
jgi:predicted HicB family RNase H-like nuclease